MNVIVTIILCFLFVFSGARSEDAVACPKDGSCSISSNCWCSSTTSPLAEGEGPQLVALTFDESVVNDTFNNLWAPLLFNRTNPDGNPISGTFFVPHEYTDYRCVQELYLHGFEIGSNTITKNSSVEYWSKATVDTLVAEFGGQRTIISKFANINISDIIGARTPFIQFGGDTTIQALIEAGIQYDNSWTSRSNTPYFPYTLDYLSDQFCRLDTSCPKQSYPGFWIAPIINILGNDSSGQPIECNALNSCIIQGTADEIAEWLVAQVDRLRSGNRAPLTLMVTSAWFRLTENSYEGFAKFLDTIGGYDDVFLVSVKQIIDWMKNPVPLEQFTTPVVELEADCLNVNCGLNNTEGNMRYMFSCVECPEVYPWLGNPEGLADPDS